MISTANPKCTETFQSCAGRTGLAILDRMIRLGNSTSGEYLESVGQAKYLARFVLAAAAEMADMPVSGTPVLHGMETASLRALRR